MLSLVYFAAYLSPQFILLHLPLKHHKMRNLKNHEKVQESDSVNFKGIILYEEYTDAT
jgi:hypothetical protein